MKFALPLCMLVVLLVCHEALCRKSVRPILGDIDIPESILEGCGHITKCYKEPNGTISSCDFYGCLEFPCEDGALKLSGDLTKLYPDCCDKCPNGGGIRIIE